MATANLSYHRVPATTTTPIDPEHCVVDDYDAHVTGINPETVTNSYTWEVFATDDANSRGAINDLNVPVNEDLTSSAGVRVELGDSFVVRATIAGTPSLDHAEQTATLTC